MRKGRGGAGGGRVSKRGRANKAPVHCLAREELHVKEDDWEEGSESSGSSESEDIPDFPPPVTARRRVLLEQKQRGGRGRGGMEGG